MSNIKLQSSTLIGFDILLENIILLNIRYFCNSAYNQKGIFCSTLNYFIDKMHLWYEWKNSYDNLQFLKYWLSVWVFHFICLVISFNQFLFSALCETQQYNSGYKTLSNKCNTKIPGEEEDNFLERRADTFVYYKTFGLLCHNLYSS